MAQKEPQNPDKKLYWKKKPGFEAFADKSQPLPSEKKNKHGKPLQSVEVKELVVPVTSIHSLEWAQAIAPQKSPLSSKLPFELRSRIWEFVISEFGGYGKAISPYDHRKIFRSVGWRTAARDTTNLYHICRQAYVDICGSGLLYKFKEFEFDSPKLMMNISQRCRRFDYKQSRTHQFQFLTWSQYLTVIKPLHKDSLRSLEITFYLSDSQPIIGPNLALEMISSMEGFRALHVHIYVYHSLCDPHPTGGIGLVKQSVVDGIRECGLWSMIRGLQSFELHFDLPDTDSENPHYGPYASDEEENSEEDGSLDRWHSLRDDVEKIISKGSPQLQT